MISRRALMGTAAATPFVWDAALREAFGDTPKDVAVMAKAIDDIISLDPQESFEYSGNEVGGNCYQKLVNPSALKPTDIQGELAEHWETSADGLTTTFRLREEQRFASGNPITAEDVAFSLSRAVILDKSPGFIISQFGLTKDNVAERIKAIDPRTVTITIGEREAPTFLLYCLSANVGGVVDKKLVMSHAEGNDMGNGWLKTNSAGSGAWIVRSWRASESVALDANPNFVGAGQIKRLIIRHVPDPSAQLLLLQKGDADIARNLNSEQIRALTGNPDYIVSSQGKASLNYIAMNQKHPMLSKPAVRQAIKWAIDYEAIEKNITPGTWEVQQAFLPKGFPAALTDRPFHKDVAKAKALLAEAGVADGFSVTLDHQSSAPHTDIAQALQADLAAVGIKVTLIAGELRQVITKTRARTHDLAMVRWGSDYFDMHSNAQTFCVNEDNSDTATNRTLAWRSSWADKDFTDRANAAVKETDADKRIAMYQQLQRDHQQRAPFAFTLQEIEVAAMRKGVSGFEIGPLSDRTTYAKIAKT